MDTSVAERVAVGRHIRHSVAKWRDRLTLRTRLSLLVALVMASVITALTYFQLRAVQQTIEQELEETARLTAETIRADVATRPSLDGADLRDWLHEVVGANAGAQVITVVQGERSGSTVLASTSSQERDEVVTLAERAMATGRAQVSRDGTVTTVALPAERRDAPLAVTVTVPMAPARLAHSRVGAVALWFTPPTVILLTLMVDMLTRRLVHAPLMAIRNTMDRVARGDLGARAPVARRDELGSIAEGLNEMLARMEHFNEALQERVRDATAELRQRNTEVEEGYRRVLSLREALAQAERLAALGQMAANVAHQVGTPLNLISGYVQILRDDPAQDTRTRRRLEIVERQIEQVTRILRAMLDRARQPSPREVLPIGRVIERACETARPRIDRSHVQLDLRLDPSVPLVEADATQLELALLMLLTNSLDAMPDGGCLRIRADASDLGVRIEVADTGHGIPPDLLPRIFEPWVTTKGVGEGTGLGLGITREVVTGHGGTISARNAPEGGAVFTIDLPCAAYRSRQHT
jgi:two-component system, NtrC family, sensor kinase